jgi:hypothetical protein
MLQTRAKGINEKIIKILTPYQKDKDKKLSL